MSRQKTGHEVYFPLVSRPRAEALKRPAETERKLRVSQKSPQAGTLGRLRASNEARTTGGRWMETAWMNEGKCRDLPAETFFPSDGVGVELARRICADCVVKG